MTFLHHCHGVCSLLYAACPAKRSADVTQNIPDPALCAFAIYADRTARPTAVCIRQCLLDPSTWRSLLANCSEGDGTVIDSRMLGGLVVR
jgi:hypothetical protein